jgi:hypothetical protein
MLEKEELLVYQYLYWDQESGTQKASTQYATLETIKKGLGIPVFTSTKTVRRDDVLDGFYTPRRQGAVPSPSTPERESEIDP